jgi:hypothetical protein
MLGNLARDDQQGRFVSFKEEIKFPHQVAGNVAQKPNMKNEW